MPIIYIKKKKIRSVTVERKSTKKNKQQKQAKRKKTTHFFEEFFTSSLPVSLSKICLAITIHLHYRMILFIKCHFLVKAVVFIDVLVKAISFSIHFAFRISALRLFKFINIFFSVCNFQTVQLLFQRNNRI